MTQSVPREARKPYQRVNRAYIIVALTSLVAGSYRIGFADALRACRAFRSHSARRWVGRGYGIIAGALGILEIAVIGPQWWSIGWFLLALILWFDLLPFEPLGLWLRSLRNPRFREECEVEASSKALGIRTSTGEVTLKWEHFIRLIETSKTFVLPCGRSSFHFVPKRAFTDEADIDAFRRIAQEQIASGSDQGTRE